MYTAGRLLFRHYERISRFNYTYTFFQVIVLSIFGYNSFTLQHGPSILQHERSCFIKHPILFQQNHNVHAANALKNDGIR